MIIINRFYVSINYSYVTVQQNTSTTFGGGHCFDRRVCLFVALFAGFVKNHRWIFTGFGKNIDYGQQKSWLNAEKL